jgi:hypothetical protein
MEIHHKVKPLHGWREFFGEVGIIVLGVLVALGAEQVVEKLHWRHLTHLGREALSDDMADIYGLATERELYSRCIARRLTEISDILDQASRTGHLPPVGPIGNPSKRQMAPVSWDSMVASQTAAHFTRDEARSYGYISAFTKELDALNVSEFHVWSQLYTIVGPGRPYTQAEDAMLRQALSEAGYDAKLLRLGAVQAKQMIRAGHLPINGKELREQMDFIKERKHLVANRAICRPLGPAPAHYGQSPLDFSLEGPVPSA